MNRSVEIISLLVCEDIRRETTNKDIIIGVFGGDIVVPTFPAWISVALWCEISIPDAGVFTVKLRLSLTGMPHFELGATVSAKASEIRALPIVGLQIEVKEPTELIIEYLSDDTWKLIKSKRIVQGDIYTAIPPIGAGLRLQGPATN